MHTDDYPRLTAGEFRDAGYLQEVNRQFFHPLGLALALHLECWGADGEGLPCATALDDTLLTVHIEDSREDPEGTVFLSLDDPAEIECYNRVAEERSEKARVRQLRFGWAVQPPGSRLDLDDGEHPDEEDTDA